MGSLQKIINLIKKTGDKVLILDKNGDPEYVIMGLADYERLIFGKSELIGLTEDELLDKINHDIEIWKDSREEDHLPIEEHDFSRDLADNEDFGVLADFDDASVPLVNTDFSLNLDKSDDEEEDRYYFEPVE